VDEREILSLSGRKVQVRITTTRFIVALESGGPAMGIEIELNPALARHLIMFHAPIDALPV
jgi:hypothetical protein